MAHIWLAQKLITRVQLARVRMGNKWLGRNELVSIRATYGLCFYAFEHDEFFLNDIFLGKLRMIRMLFKWFMVLGIYNIYFFLYLTQICSTRQDTWLGGGWLP